MTQPEEIKAKTPPAYRRKVEDDRYTTPVTYYMRSGQGDGGRLMRMVDVVAWLMDACDIPRSIAVKAVCDAFEGREDAVFIIEEDEYARLITSANSFDYRPIIIGRAWEEKPKFIGLAGALNQMRTCWSEGLDTSYTSLGIDEVAVPYDLVCALFVSPAARVEDIPRIHAVEAPKAPTEYERLVAYRKDNPADWPADHQRIIHDRYMAGKNGTEARITHLAMGESLGVEKQRIGQIIKEYQATNSQQDTASKATFWPGLGR